MTAIECPKDPQAAAAWRRKHDPNSFEALQTRLEFLQSRANSHSDPYIQKLIAETEARITDKRILHQTAAGRRVERLKK